MFPAGQSPPPHQMAFRAQQAQGDPDPRALLSGQLSYTDVGPRRTATTESTPAGSDSAAAMLRRGHLSLPTGVSSIHLTATSTCPHSLPCESHPGVPSPWVEMSCHTTRSDNIASFPSLPSIQYEASLGMSGGAAQLATGQRLMSLEISAAGPGT